MHFLQINDISVVRVSLWVCDSAWHSGQSNHCLQHGARMETCAFRMCLLYEEMLSQHSCVEKWHIAFGGLTTFYARSVSVQLSQVGCGTRIPNCGWAGPPVVELTFLIRNLLAPTVPADLSADAHRRSTTHQPLQYGTVLGTIPCSRAVVVPNTVSYEYEYASLS